jgi:hypothetical protein
MFSLTHFCRIVKIYSKQRSHSTAKSFAQFLHDHAVTFARVRKNTSAAILFAVLEQRKMTSAVLLAIQRTKAKQAVEIAPRGHRMAWKIFTRRVLKKGEMLVLPVDLVHKINPFL